MKTIDFLQNINTCIIKNIRTYWKSGYIDIDYDEVSSWGINSLSEIMDYAYESLLWKIPYTFDVVMSTDYLVRVKAKNWREPQTGWLLYKYYVKDELVYIGRTINPVRRFFEHIEADRRFRQVTRFEIYECKSKSDMILLERVLIGEKRPPWNVVDADNGAVSFKLPEMEFKSYNLFEFVAQY